MKRLSILLFVLISFSCAENFLDNPPTIGLTDDKVSDLASMQALIYGAYGEARPLVHQSALYAAGMVRDVLNRNRGEYDQFYDHQVGTTMTSWQYDASYRVLGALNTVYVNDLEAMGATENEKNSILGDVHFLRALVYFDLNNYWALPSTGYSVPLVLAPLGPDDRVVTARTEDIVRQIEEDIELARTYFENTSGVADYHAATALAARIYFYHKKYDLAYARANEVIGSNSFSLESDVAAAFSPPGNSQENIFTILFNTGDGSGNSPSARIWEAYQANPANGFYSVNPDGIAYAWYTDPNDARYNAFYSEDPNFLFVNGKYSTDQMHYIYIRLAEMYLTRAEANVMQNNTVIQQDVDDVNVLRTRAVPGSELTSIPAVSDMLDILLEDRTRELAFELGDHFLNRRRLQLPIIQTEQEGGGLIPFEEYSEYLVYPFPTLEVDIHGLTRSPN